MITKRLRICFHFEGAPHGVVVTRGKIGINSRVLRLESELVVFVDVCKDGWELKNISEKRGTLQVHFLFPTNTDHFLKNR